MFRYPSAIKKCYQRRQLGNFATNKVESLSGSKVCYIVINIYDYSKLYLYVVADVE